ncbi:MAG: LegC family aminotransferase [Syntrophales bacterium]|jgi:perosamine synthetase|nr:LegC family aminotransferase [Syntrophales bacterium]MDY0043764.1 LegC family aminotransferase [Syntrophales bacterium]
MTSAPIRDVIRALESVIPSGKKPAVLHEPSFQGNEWTYVRDCLNSTYVSYVGRYVDKFESMLAEFTEVKKAVAVVNGTSALHIALKLAGVGPHDEVLCPAFTFVATANAISYCGAIPHFIDSEEATLGIDPRKLKDYLKDIVSVDADGCKNKWTGRRIKAVIPVHTFGHPVDLDPVMELCNEYSIEMIEDAAESLGSYYKGTHTGNWGKLSILSFNGNKTITTGGGGALITNDENLGMLAKHLTSTAKIPHPWAYCHDHTGYNYRLPNINAAVGCAQMEQLSIFLEKKRKLAAAYEKAFASIPGISFFKEPPFARSNYWLNALLLDESASGLLEPLLEATHLDGIMTRPAWQLMPRLSMFKDCPAMDLSCAESLVKRLINIPSSPFLLG